MANFQNVINNLTEKLKLKKEWVDSGRAKLLIETAENQKLRKLLDNTNALLARTNTELANHHEKLNSTKNELSKTSAELVKAREKAIQTSIATGVENLKDTKKEIVKKRKRVADDYSLSKEYVHRLEKTDKHIVSMVHMLIDGTRICRVCNKYFNLDSQPQPQTQPKPQPVFKRRRNQPQPQPHTQPQPQTQPVFKRRRNQEQA